MANYFENVKTLNDLKAEYRRLVLKHHPDVGGDVETMKAINIEIACAPWHLELEFRREYSSVRNCVTYISEILRVYDVPGIDRQIVQRQTWPGKERHAALKAFDEIVRQHPGAPITRKLERSPWERR